MLRKITFYVAACTMCSFMLQAQVSQPHAIEWTQKLKTPLVQDLNILKMDVDNLYYTSSNVIDENVLSGFAMTTKPHVYRYDYKSGLLVDRELKLKTGNTRRAFEKVLMLGNTIHVFSSFINNDQKKYYIFDETLGLDSLEQKNDVKKIAELDFGTLNHGKPNSLFTTFKMVRDRLLIQSRITTENGFYTTNDIFDCSLNIKASYNYSSVGKEFVAVDWTIDRNDGFYVLNSYTNDKKEPSYDIFHYSKDTSEVKKQTISGLQMVGTTQMAVNRQNGLIVAGLFAKPKQESAIGTFSIVFPAELAHEGKLNTFKFSDEFLTMGYDKKDAAELLKDIKKNKEFNDKCGYQIDTIDIRENGDFSFLTEKSKVVAKTTSHTSYNGSTGSYTTSGSKTTYYYTFGDIYVCSYLADGSLKWCTNLDKNVILTDLNVIRGHYLPYRGKDGNINLILSTFKKNNLAFLKIFGIESVKIDKTNIVSFDLNGNRQNKVLFADSKVAKKIIPMYSKVLDEQSFLFTRSERFLNMINYKVGRLKFTSN